MNPSQTRTTRSAFLKYGAGGLASAGLAGAGLSRWSFPAHAQSLDETDGFLNLFVNDGYGRMVDDRLVYMRGFGELDPTLDPDLSQADPRRLTHPPRVFLTTAAKPGLQPRPDPVLLTPGPGDHFPSNRNHDPDRSRFPFDDCTVPPLQDDHDQLGRKLMRRECPDADKDDGIKPTQTKAFWEGHLHLIKQHTSTSFWPRRVIIAESGREIRLKVKNNVAQTLELTVTGSQLLVSDPPVLTDVAFVPHGQTVVIVLGGPANKLAPGTYIFYDRSNVQASSLPFALRSVYESAEAVPSRAIGLHDVLVVLPSGEFDKGKPSWWKPHDGANAPEFERQFVWIMADVIDLSEPDPIVQGATKRGYTPRYFTINDNSGVNCVAHSLDDDRNRHAFESTKPYGYVREFSIWDVRDGKQPGQLIRMANTGIAVHQPHFHGNHVRVLMRNAKVLDNTSPKLIDGRVEFEIWKDVVPMPPLHTTEVMLPVKPPPDSVVLPHQIGAHSAGADEPDEFPEWDYPMHRHDEMSQTAAGGLYPNGALSDWILKP